MISSISTEPEIKDDNGKLTSLNLSMVARAVFVQTEEGPITKAEMNRISGMVAYDHSSTLAWVHE